MNDPHWSQGLLSHTLFFCNADRVKDDQITDVSLRVHPSQIQKHDAEEIKHSEVE